MDQLTTASGQVMGYGYSNNRVTSISVNGVALLGSVTYDPFGPAVAWLWPSATTPALKTYRDYDLDGRMIRWELKNGVSYIQRDVVWDNASRVTNLKDLLTTTQANNQGFGYDALDRLSTTTLGTTTTPIQTLAYDAIGNRTSATINGIMSTYHLPTNSHKLTSTVGGTNPRAFTYDAMGNLTNDGKYTNTYLNNGRLRTVVWTAGTTTNTVTYDLNALGQRVRKTAPSSVGGSRLFMYDEAGRLTGEYDSAGNLVQETVWLGDLPVATLRPQSGSTTTPIAIDIFYVHADHLGTPRAITRPTDNKVVWSWENTEAFGNNAPNENPSALGAFKYNLRMPGQYWDQETGNFQNYFRDYDSSLGRYVQSDPIGFFGGINSYAYVSGAPLAKIDPWGLAECTFTMSTGQMSCRPANPRNPAVVIPAASGNNGDGQQCRNNPACTAIPNRGPIPTGCWRWTDGATGKPNGRVLEPCPGTNTNSTENRTLIRSHSCANPFGPGVGPQYCSEGCVTGTAPDIQRLNGLIDAEPGSTLRVVP